LGKTPPVFVQFGAVEGQSPSFTHIKLPLHDASGKQIELPVGAPDV
jgi:hypothetical protein